MEKACSYGIKAGGHEVVLLNRPIGSFSIKTGRSPINKRKGGRVQVVKLNEKHIIVPVKSGKYLDSLAPM